MGRDWTRVELAVRPLLCGGSVEMGRGVLSHRYGLRRRWIDIHGRSELELTRRGGAKAKRFSAPFTYPEQTQDLVFPCHDATTPLPPPITPSTHSPLYQNARHTTQPTNMDPRLQTPPHHSPPPRRPSPNPRLREARAPGSD